MKRTISAEIDNWDVIDSKTPGLHIIQVRVHFIIPTGKNGTKDIWRWVSL